MTKGSDFPARSSQDQPTRPECIKHYSEIQHADDARYPDSSELLSIGSPFSKSFGLSKLGIHYEVLPPGRRTSWPHAESDEDEFAYVIEGKPHVWINGELHPLKPGDGIGFPSGTGMSHTFINNTDENVSLLVVGEASKKSNRIFYPRNPERRNQMAEGQWWSDVPEQKMGGHDGLPSKRHVVCPECQDKFSCQPRGNCWCLEQPVLKKPSRKNPQACRCPRCFEQAVQGQSGNPASE